MFKPSKEKLLVGCILFLVYTLTLYVESFSAVYLPLPFIIMLSFIVGIIWVINFHDLERYQDYKVKKRIGIFLWVKFILFLITNVLFYFELINLGKNRDNYLFYLYIMIAFIVIITMDIYIIIKKP